MRVLILHTTEPSRAIDVFSRKARISPEDLRVRILDYKSPNKNIQDNMFEIISLSSDPACFKFRVMDNKGFTRMLACLREALCVSTSVEWEDGETVVLTLEDNSGGVLGQEKVTDIVHWWLSGYKMGNTK